MATTSIGSGESGFVAAELIQSLTIDLAQGISVAERSGTKAAGTQAPQAFVDNGRNAQPSAGSLPGNDVSTILLAEVATSDLAKLGQILNPAPNPETERVLASLMGMALQEVGNGSAERAIGYLADYATRDPRRGELLGGEPALEPVRDKIDSMVGRMTLVAKMSAENGLSHAEQSASELTGKLPTWNTSADVLIKLAHQFFEAGGYANYAKSAELSRAVSDSVRESKPAVQAMAAVAAGQMQALQLSATPDHFIQGVNVPYWLSTDYPVDRPAPLASAKTVKRDTNIGSDIVQNLHYLKQISSAAVRQLWQRAPLLVMMMAWFALGLTGGIAYALASRVWPGNAMLAAGGLVFTLWALGFLALVGFGFYVRVRYRPLR